MSVEALRAFLHKLSNRVQSVIWLPQACSDGSLDSLAWRRAEGLSFWKNEGAANLSPQNDPEKNEVEESLQSRKETLLWPQIKGYK